MNLLNGYGPTFNIDERVQPYTHPLWFLLLSIATFVSRNIFVSAFGLCIVCSMIVLWLLISKLATGFWPGILAGVGLLLSKAYLDFSTSCLENPLSHLMLAIGLLLGFKALDRDDGQRYARWSVLVLLSIYLSRPDLILLVFPFCIVVLWRCHRSVRETAITVACAIAPTVLWTIFSLVYYGTPFPNTAYAKLGTGISTSEYVRQGIAYLGRSISYDPITVTFTAMGILLAMRGSLALKAIAIGIVAYLVYVLSIGGDFMLGRFLTVPLLAAAVILARTEFTAVGGMCVAVVFVALGAISLPGAMLSGRGYVNRDMGWALITDERGFLFQGGGLVTVSRDAFVQPPWTLNGLTVKNSCGLLGAEGLISGPSTHVIDSCALADPLLARLPALYDVNWRIGHFNRELPSGYTQSFLDGKNLILDPATRRFWDVIRTVTRGPLFSIDRFKAILRLNLGLVQKPDRELYRSGKLPPVVVDIGKLSAETAPSITWDDPSNKIFDSAIEVRLPTAVQISSLDVALASNGKYLLEYQTSNGWQRIAEVGRGASMMDRHRISLPQPTPMTDRIRITALDGQGLYSLGHLILNR
jgi:arabinofuranosyltransferase